MLIRSRSWLPALLLALSLAASQARANPHVWVESGMTFELGDRSVEGVTFAWRFDDYYSSHAIRIYDIDRNGALGDAELGALRTGAFDPLAQFGYYVHVWARGARLEGQAVDRFTARIEDRRLVFEFSVPVAPPVDPVVDPLTVSLFDESNAVDFRFMESGFLLVRGELHEDCRFRVARGQGEQEGHPRTVTLACGD